MQEETKPGLRPGVRNICFALAAVLILLIGFVSGYISCLLMRSAVSSDFRSQYLQNPGDASPAVRSGVLTALQAFQDGYAKRDSKVLDSFADRLIAKNDDVLMLGTNAREWARGYAATEELIKGDWQGWGDFRFDVNDSIIRSSGNVAWVSSIGEVRFKNSERPVRFSAVLTNNGSSWLFQEIQFQWDERDPSTSDIFHPKTYLTLVRLAFRRATTGP